MMSKSTYKSMFTFNPTTSGVNIGVGNLGSFNVGFNMGQNSRTGAGTGGGSGMMTGGSGMGGGGGGGFGMGQLLQMGQMLTSSGFVDPRSLIRNFKRKKAIVPPDYGSEAGKPVPISRGGGLADASMAFDELKTQLLSQNELFEDPEFPAEDSSLYYSHPPNRNIQWLRPSEICSNPEFITGGASRFDVRQGELGDCWLLAAIACLSMDEKLMRQVVVPDQDFVTNYRGMFRFRFWRFGQWREVVIDDRLPTYQGRLLFIHSTEKNEFWSALFEKAYAKMFGSYEALKGGSTSEALEDFTGGICEMFDLREKTLPNLLNIMLKSQERRSLMGCSIDADPNRVEAELPNGLIMGHAYSITAVKQFNLPNGRNVTLVRIRNPWGNEAEWTGDWSDRSPNWSMLPGVNDSKADGEFWMSYEDFTREFQKLEICHLGPQSLSGEGDQPNRKWELCVENGRWIKGVTAGGCRNFINTFPNNPQFRITIVDPDENDAENLGTVIVGLMQKNRRAKRGQGIDLLTIGYMIYKAPEGFSGVADVNFFKMNRAVAKSNSFINLREVCGRHKLEPGDYIIVPSTFHAGEEGDFMVRIFAERPPKSSEADETFGVDESRDMVSDLNPEQTRALKEAFDKVADSDGQIDAEVFRDVLNAAFTKNFKFTGFTLETCRSMVAMMDVDRSGKLDFEEFKILWNNLKLWKSAFKKVDKDKSGTMGCLELRAALKDVGFSVNNRMLETLALRYAHSDGTLLFDEYVICCARLRTLFDIYNTAQKGDDNQLMMNEQHFFNNLLYM